MIPNPWYRRGLRHVFETPIFAVYCHELTSPRTGGTRDFYIIDSVDWCAIVPITDEGQVVMVRQQRHGIGEVTLELPGGMIDPEDATPAAAAERELLEETGYASADVMPIGVTAPNPAMMSNRCHFFVARGARLVAPIALDDGEDVEVVLVPLREIPTRIAAGEIVHSLMVVAFTFALGLRASDDNNTP